MERINQNIFRAQGCCAIIGRLFALPTNPVSRTVERGLGGWKEGLLLVATATTAVHERSGSADGTGVLGSTTRPAVFDVPFSDLNGEFYIIF